jgi:hypothetical protein
MQVHGYVLSIWRIADNTRHTDFGIYLFILDKGHQKCYCLASLSIFGCTISTDHHWTTVGQRDHP